MKTTILFSLFLILNFTALAQDDQLSDDLKQLYQQEQFDKIILLHSDKAEVYSAKAVYYIGLAYYMKEDDVNCINMMDLAINKDSQTPHPFYIKGKTLQYLGDHDQAIKNLNAALKLAPENGEFYSALGDSYFEVGKLDKALEAYTLSTKQKDAPDRAYVMIPQVYSDKGNTEEALTAFYNAKDKVSKESSSYITVLYNIGLMESLKGNYDKAEPIFKELLTIDPADYQTYAKLIQIYFAKKEYAKAAPLREKLYAAKTKGLLLDNLEEMFCFDQFKWNDKLIQVFERYDEPKGKIYYKHIFHVINKAGYIEYSIQTENSPISIEQGGPQYLIGMRKDNSHYTFNVGFNSNPDYDNLKRTVIEVLDGKIKPTASSKRSE
ncbi:tetratricopeptide repeat protein [Pontibacter anaerobius]|uniref:Tetratricopeptide repeat protein n=1 Tax=Pontibacter anaerobius TaxID=2993940 RepID=A0ABT3RAJ5_9BACT|nr:tetratricopeptide repeat protein [Pontibacter anaerobius]MCX2738397.1 tetratricopeptide repeat protein [Pontibacter anaerobius]